MYMVGTYGVLIIILPSTYLFKYDLAYNIINEYPQNWDRKIIRPLSGDAIVIFIFLKHCRTELDYFRSVEVDTHFSGIFVLANYDKV